jgi:homogentisate 1,2-dioxygenase
MVTILYHPRVIYQIDFETSMDVVCRIFAPFYTPKRYKNESGQHLNSPFCERDFILSG